MSNVMQFPGGRSVPPRTTVDALLDELTAVELELARARLAKLRGETRQGNALWLSYCLKRVVFWGLLLWLLTTFAGAAEAGTWRTFYNANGGFAGSSTTPGKGKFTNYYDRNGQFVGSAVRLGVTRR